MMYIMLIKQGVSCSFEGLRLKKLHIFYHIETRWEGAVASHWPGNNDVEF